MPFPGLFLQLRVYRDEYMTMVDSVGIRVVVHKRGVFGFRTTSLQSLYCNGHK